MTDNLYKKSRKELTKYEPFKKKQEEMPDAELAELARKEVSKLCKTGGRSLRMTVPPRVEDTDMLLCELIRRFKKLTTNKNQRLKL